MRLPDQPMPARGSVFKRGCLHDTWPCRRTSRLSAETDRQPVMVKTSNPGGFPGWRVAAHGHQNDGGACASPRLMIPLNTNTLPCQASPGHNLQTLALDAT
jgi:hypothetical protein